MIKTYVLCDRCPAKIELQPDQRYGMQAGFRLPPGWEAKHEHGLTRHLCPACKVPAAPAQSLEVKS